MGGLVIVDGLQLNFNIPGVRSSDYSAMSLNIELGEGEFGKLNLHVEDFHSDDRHRVAESESFRKLSMCRHKDSVHTMQGFSTFDVSGKLFKESLFPVNRINLAIDQWLTNG